MLRGLNQKVRGQEPVSSNSPAADAVPSAERRDFERVMDFLPGPRRAARHGCVVGAGAPILGFVSRLLLLLASAPLAPPRPQVESPSPALPVLVTARNVVSPYL